MLKEDLRERPLDSIERIVAAINSGHGLCSHWQLMVVWVKLKVVLLVDPLGESVVVKKKVTRKWKSVFNYKSHL